MKKLIKNQTIQDSLICLTLGVIFGIYNIYKTVTLNVKVSWIMSPYLFPLLLTVFILAVSISMFFEGKHQVEASEETEKAEAVSVGKVGKAIVIIGMAICYDILMQFISFIPATIIVLAAMMWYLGERKILRLVLISVISPLLLYLIFKTGLNVNLP